MEYTDNKIYLDYAATTPVDPRVIEAMRPFFDQYFGNPSSIHWHGQQAEAAVEAARSQIAGLLNAQPGEMIFTSCGTESDNLAIRGVALAAHKKRGANHILISPVEHHAVLHTAQQLADHFGFELEYLPVDSNGMVDPDDVAAWIRPETAIVSVIYGNNEIGTVNPIAEIGRVCRQRGIPFHTDAVQAAGYFPIDVERESIDLMSIGAHKFYGPKGVGALYVRHGIDLLPTQTGGGQEGGRRAGTQNVPYIVGMAEALRLVRDESVHLNQLSELRDRMVEQVLKDVPRARFTGHPFRRLPNHASFVFDRVDGNALLMMLDVAGFACSSGSACKTGNPEPSDVLTSIGIPRSWALGSLRVTLGRGTTADHIESFLDALPGLVAGARISS